MDKNKTGKYLKYAIGEIALVMIGILLALQVNNQNEIRKSNNLYKTYEQNIISELKTDLLILHKRDSLLNIGSATIENYVEYYNSENPNMLILKSKADSTYLSLGYFSTSTYSIEDLISTGNLKLFPTHKRNAILKYKNYADSSVFGEIKSLEEVGKVSLEFRKNVDILFLYGYSEKEHSQVKNWEYNIDSPQMRLRNNQLAYYLNLYRKQKRKCKNTISATNELIRILEKNNKG
jgi:hypothetical protein